VAPQSREARFVALAAPSGEEVTRVLADTAGRTARALERIGLAPDADGDEADPLVGGDPLLATLCAVRGQGRVATGAHVGEPDVPPKDLHPYTSPGLPVDAIRVSNVARYSVGGMLPIGASSQSCPPRYLSAICYRSATNLRGPDLT
jgi:hypothetical protein